MKTSYTQTEIDSMVNDVTSQLDALLKSEGATLLKKSDDCAPGESLEMTQKAAPDASASPEASPSASPAPEASASASPGADASLPDDSAGAAPAPEGSAPAGDAPPSMDELVQAYGSLPPEELQLHAQALAQVMQSKQASPAPSAAPAAAAPAPAAPAAAPLAGEGSQQAAPEAQAALKSEVAGLKEELVALRKHSEQLANIVKNVVKPIVVSPGKAVTGETVLVKTEAPSKPLNKAEVTKRLNDKARDPNLAKSDRDLIRKYYTGAVTLKSLEHLFNK